MNKEGVQDKELALWFIAKGCTLEEANCYADETIREIEFVKDYEVYQEERLDDLDFDQKVEISKRFIPASREGAVIIS
jgi:hypothetical protein